MPGKTAVVRQPRAVQEEESHHGDFDQNVQRLCSGSSWTGANVATTTIPIRVSVNPSNLNLGTHEPGRSTGRGATYDATSQSAARCPSAPVRPGVVSSSSPAPSACARRRTSSRSTAWKVRPVAIALSWPACGRAELHEPAADSDEVRHRADRAGNHGIEPSGPVVLGARLHDLDVAQPERVAHVFEEPALLAGGFDQREIEAPARRWRAGCRGSPRHCRCRRRAGRATTDPSSGCRARAW